MRRPVLSALTLIAITTFGQPGTLDPTYGDQGIRLIGAGPGFHRVQEVIALEDQTSLTCGVATNDGQDRAVLMHLMSDGTLDTAFGESGYVWIMNGLASWAHGMALTDDGSIVVVGWVVVEDFSAPSALVAKFHADGAADASFGDSGLSIFLVNGAPAFLYDVEVDPDGGLVACGIARDANGANNGLLVRLNPDGTMDPTFSGDGILVNTAFPLGTEDDVLEDVKILADGTILAAGGGLTGAGDHWSIVFKTDSTGVPDPAFGNNGTLVPELGSLNNYAYGLLADAEGILICGFQENAPSARDAMVAKLNSDGTLDSLFGTAGVVVVEDSAWNESAMDMAMQSDGKLVVTGHSGEYGDFGYGEALLFRLIADGSFDTGFGEAGMVRTDVQSSFDGGLAIAIQPDARILVGGRAASFDNVNYMFVARYLPDACAVFPSVSPEALILCPNSTGELTTGAFDTYQWYKNGLTIPGATSQTLPVTSADDVGSWFMVRTTIDTCFGFSDSVLVDGYTFLPPVVINAGDAPNLIGDNGEQIYCQGDDPVLVLGAPYDTNVQWSVNGEPIPGANDTLYAVPGSGSYTVEGAHAVCPDFIQNPGVAVVMDFHPYVQPTIYQTGILLCPQPEGLSSQWYYNGQPVAGFEQCVIPIDAGNYTVFVDYGDSCSVLSAPFYLVGLDEYAHADMKAAPVPTPNQVTITWAEGGALSDWRVIDVTGRIVRSGTKATSPLTIDLGMLDVGRYRFLSGDGRSLPLAVTH